MSTATLLPLLASALPAAGWVATAWQAVRLRRRLLTDPLTGLANREALVRAFAVAKRRGRALGVVIIDLDYFKVINDVWGHDAGNTLLRHVADQLAFTCGGYGRAVPVRLHGDEFAVLLADLPLGAPGVELVERHARQLAVAISTPVTFGVDQLAVTGSAGVAVSPAAHAELSTLLRVADQRMYTAKKADRQRVQAARGWSA